MAKVVVTGGGGFIGSHIVDALIKRGDEVHVVDTFVTGRKENLAHCKDSITIHEVSITDTKSLTEIFSRADVVYHQAAVPSVPKSVELPLETNEANITGTLSVFVSARDAGVRRVVFASSSSVYGDTPTLPKVETMPKTPLSPYAAQKMMCEVYAELFSRLYNIEIVGLRYFNVFGPRQNPNSEYAAVIPKFISVMKKGEAPAIYGDGTQTRDFTYVSNVVDANISAGNTPGLSFEVFNIAGGGQISLNDLVADINTLLGENITPKYAESRVGDIRDSFADIQKARKTLGFSCSVSFADGLKKTAESL